MKKIKIEIKRTVELTEEMLENILACALEGGSNYWYCIGDIDRSLFTKGLPLVTNLAKSFFKNPNYEVPFYDIDSADEPAEMDFLGNLTLDSIKEGMQLMALNHPNHFEDFINETGDADTGDIWLQLCVMKDIVFC